jgi:hypothetical protein
MGVPASEIGQTSATAGRGDHKVHKGHAVALVVDYAYTIIIIIIINVAPLPAEPA